jgi:hypothetical protein
MEASLQAAAISSGTVAILCGIIALASWRALLRTGNARIRLVVLAFSLLAAKNLVKCVRLASGSPESGGLELAFSLVDLAAVALIAWPLLLRRGA